MNTESYVNPTFGLREVESNVEKIWCQYIFESKPQHIAYLKVGGSLYVSTVDGHTQKGYFSVGVKDFLFSSSLHDKYFVLFSGLYRRYSLSTTSDYEERSDDIEHIFNNGYVTSEGIIYKFGIDGGNEYFKSRALTIEGVQSYRDSIFIIGSNGNVYVFVESADVAHLPTHLNFNNCFFSQYSNPYIINPGWSIRQVLFASDGPYMLISYSDWVLHIGNTQIHYDLDDDITPYKAHFHHSDFNMLIIGHDKNLYVKGIYRNMNRLVSFIDYPAIREAPYKIAYEMEKSSTLGVTFAFSPKVPSYATGDNLKLSPYYTLANKLVDICILDDGEPMSISNNSILTNHFERIVDDFVPERIRSFGFFKEYNHALILSKDKHLVHVKYTAALGFTFIKILEKSVEVDEIYGCCVRVKAEDGSFAYYGAGHNFNSRFGTSLGETILEQFDLGSVGNPTLYEPKMRKIGFDSIPLSNIKKVVFGDFSMFVITKDNELYGRGDNARKTISNSNAEIVSVFTKIEGGDQYTKQGVCDVIITQSPCIFVKTCSGKLYRQGSASYPRLHYDNKSLTAPLPITEEIKLPYPLQKLREVDLDSNSMSLFIFDTHALDCNTETCVIDEDVEVVGEEINWENTQTTIVSNVTIIGGNVIVNIPPGGAPIIVDGGQLILDSTTLTYKIEDRKSVV